MTATLPTLSEFRIELPGNGLAHVVFDAPGRSMNVFSEAAIVDIGRIARWLEEADVRGALIRSGKTTGFCAGANLPEIWAAYDMVLAHAEAAPFRDRLRSFLPSRASRYARSKPAASRSPRRSPGWRSAVAASLRCRRTIAF